MRCITLTTDFGIEDGYAGLLKGVIWNIVPEAQIADLSHQIAPQDIIGGALVLARSAPYFPPGTVHVGVVDPGVGTKRRSIAAKIGEHFFVGPDNGLFSLLAEKVERSAHQKVEVYELNQPQTWLINVSASFHGRDIFSPTAAHIANGVPLHELGTPIDDAVRISLPLPIPSDNGWRGQVIHIDHFGNVATNITAGHLKTFGNPFNTDTLHIHFGETSLRHLLRSFGEGSKGQIIALMDSSGYLSLCVINGNAAERLHANLGDSIEVSTP